MSRPRPQAPSLSRGLLAAKSLDPFERTRSTLAKIAEGTDEWAGIPLPIEGERLIVEPSYPFASLVSSKPAPSEDDGWRLRNIWYDRRWRCDVLVMEKDGKVEWGRLPAFHSLKHALSTLGCSFAWGLEQEQKAMQLLGTMVRHVQMKQYVLTGSFLERSPRSGLVYLFRRLRPTVVIRPDDHGSRILCALCMHPIAYYAESWAGAMCPTDDVIAHLAMMRGDEHMLWKRCNQHPPYRPEAGL